MRLMKLYNIRKKLESSEEAAAEIRVRWISYPNPFHQLILHACFAPMQTAESLSPPADMDAANLFDTTHIPSSDIQPK